jgi:DNA-directed RNA polymerase subunit M/transcription elongation factor TFIIS
MKMIRFKACPKCRGDIHVAEDIHGKYLSCLQCGYLKDLPNEPVVGRKPVFAGREQEVQRERVAA